MDRQKTGALIAQMRKERGLTQRELAEQLHVSDRAVSKWERGAGFPDVSMLIPLAEALGLSVLELLRGEQSRPGAPSRRAERSLRFGGCRTAHPGFRPAGPGLETSGAVETICLRRPGCGRSGSVAGRLRLVLWLAVCGLISLPANRTCLARVYQDGQQQELTLVRWSGTLQFRLPLRWEFRGQIQTPLAQTTLDPDRELHLALPLTWDKATSLSHQSWNGNIREREGPFLSAPFYLDWWGGEFAFSLSDGRIVASSPDACAAWTQEFGEKASASP